MNIHEYQARELLQKFDVATTRGKVASTLSEVEQIASELGHVDLVVKAQIHAGGRGKGTFNNGFKGGVHLSKSPAHAREIASKMLGQTLVTHQTGPAGRVVNKVLVAESAEIAREIYFAILLDRATAAPEIVAMRDIAEEDPREVEASKHGLSYIGLDGNIACLVNGAGLAMATMDIIKFYGGEPANFLDVGGGATEEQVTEAFKILISDKKVKAILVNIFGGIMKCDVIAQGIINAAKTVHLSVPLVVRLEGTNVEKGKRLLKESGVALITADDLADAAQKAVAAAKSDAAAANPKSQAPNPK